MANGNTPDLGARGGDNPTTRRLVNWLPRRRPSPSNVSQRVLPRRVCSSGRWPGSPRPKRPGDARRPKLGAPRLRR